MDRELLRNGSGYIDPTAYKALNNVQKGINKMENMKANRFEPKRGDVYFISKKDTKTGEIKAIPGVVVSSDEYNDGSEYIMVADISERANTELNQNAPIMCRVPSIAMCDRMRMVKREWFGEYIRTATDEEMQALADALGFVFGIVVNMTDVILKGGNPAEEQEQIIEKQKQADDSADYKQMLQWKDYSSMLEIDLKSRKEENHELKMIVEEQAKEIEKLHAINNEMANIDFYRQFYKDLFYSGKKIEIKVG